jgi:hypothetical protein
VEVAMSEYDTITNDMHPLARRFLRGCMVLAVLLSLSDGLGLLTYTCLLEPKVAVFSCLSVGVRFSFYNSYTLATVVCTYV